MPAPCETRLAQLQAMLAGRTDPAGNPLKGYGKSVAALKAEIARLADVAVGKPVFTAADKAALKTALTAPAADPTESAKPVFRPHKPAVDTAPAV